MTTVKNSAKPAAAKTSTNGWTDENTALAVKLYQEALAADPDNANSADTLKAIAEATSAKSIASVRSKLTSEKVYVKPELPRKVGGGTSVRKVHFVRAIHQAAKDHGLEVEDDSFDSLESGKVSALRLLCELLGAKVVGE